MKILDFGLAKLKIGRVAPRAPLVDGNLSGGSQGTASPTTADAEASTIVQPAAETTEPGMVLGTPAYMSPEQVRGEPADHRADIFAFGCVLYEMLSGTRAFRRDTPVASMNAVLNEEPPDLTSACTNIPPSLERVVRRCLEKQPERRFQSAQDMAFAIEVASNASGTRPSSGVGAHRKPLPARLLVAGMVLLLLVAAGGMAIGKWGSKTRRSAAPSIRYLTYSGRDYSPTASADGKRFCFTSDRDGTKRIWIKEMSSGLESPLTAGPDDFPRLSPDGSSVLFTRSRGSERSLYRAPVIPGEPNKILNDAQFGDWSPDGRRIAFVRWPEEGGSVVGIAGVDGSAEKIVHRIPEYRCTIPRWSPDGRSLAISINDRGLPQSLAVIDLESGKVRPLPATHGYNLLSAATWEASGRHIFWSQAESASANSGGSTAAIFRQSVRSGEIEKLLWNPTHSRVLDMLPNGNLLLDSRSSRSGNLEVWIANADGSSPRQVTRDGFAAENPTMTRDGRWIVYSSAHPKSSGIWKIKPDGSDATRLVPGAMVGNPEVSPDGEYAAYADSKSMSLASVKVVEIESGASVFETQIPVYRETSVLIGRTRWMPDGKSVVFLGQNAAGVNGLFEQDFVPGKDTAASRRPLAGFDAENSAESFGISHDGQFITIAMWEQFFSIMVTEDLSSR